MDQTPMDVTASGEKETSRDRPQDSSNRHSPAPPLAPLEYLQNQRRGSITDPFLHAASPNPPSQSTPVASSSSNSPAGPNSFRQDFLTVQTHSSSRSTEVQSRNTSLVTRSSSPYIFGDASAQPTSSSKPSRRSLLHNSPEERGKGGAF
ncbi:hypothetical protein DFH11DRAFT_662445 [Phellopilus nigrolimitatus]|nr:hypothetical protein DFH11DRAFT_662445 [Phellopilus nigrolimitatus]